MVKTVDATRPGLVYACECGFRSKDISRDGLKEFRIHFLKKGTDGKKGVHKSLDIIDAKTGEPFFNEDNPKKGHPKVTRPDKEPKSQLPVAEEENPSEDSGGSSPESTKKGKEETKKPAASKVITAGRINITLEDWTVNQYGATIILDTYNKAKKDIGYNGTVGEYIVDVFTLHRRIMNYGGVNDGRGNSEGGDGHQPDDEKGLGELIGADNRE